MTKSNKVWGYSKDDARIFDLPEGESLPEGYFDSPAKVVEEEPKKQTKKKPDTPAKSTEEE